MEALAAVLSPMRTLLHEVGPGDPATLAIMAVLMAVAALVDPVVALRDE